MGEVKHERNNLLCDPWDSKGTKMQFLFLVLFALKFGSEMKI